MAFTKGAEADLEFALDLCLKAGLVLEKYFQKALEVNSKPDGTVVTRADKETEDLIVQAIAKRFPEDGILGEEGGERKGLNQRKWIIDPLDGTYNFTRGIPIFSVLIALEEEDEIVLGLIHAPAANDTFYARAGGGAFKNGKPLACSQENELGRSQFNFGSPKRILKSGYWQAFSSLVDKTYWQRCYGDYLNFTSVFEGKSEIALEVGLYPWDLAPMKILALESGGRFSDLKGGQSVYEGSALVTNGKVHEEALSILACASN